MGFSIHIHTIRYIEGQGGEGDGFLSNVVIDTLTGISNL